jgi:hypothetical protein
MYLHSLTVHSTLSYRKAIIRYHTRTVENLGNLNHGKLSTLQYAIVQETHSTRALANYSKKSRYCETRCICTWRMVFLRECHLLVKPYDLYLDKNLQPKRDDGMAVIKVKGRFWLYTSAHIRVYGCHQPCSVRIRPPPFTANMSCKPGRYSEASGTSCQLGSPYC